jgi:exonuclease VII large subunit
MEETFDPTRASLSVTELNRMAREALESRFPPLWVRGEISNLTRAPSGHLYFTLKDRHRTGQRHARRSPRGGQSV